jgi:hypothetical protein
MHHIVKNHGPGIIEVRMRRGLIGSESYNVPPGTSLTGEIVSIYHGDQRAHYTIEPFEDAAITNALVSIDK